MNFPKVLILDKGLANLGVINYISLDYNEDFYAVGSECKLVVPLTKKGSTITKGMYLHLPNKHRSRTAIIIGIEYIEGFNDLISITALPAKAITKRRLNLRPANDTLALANFGYDSVPQYSSANTEILKPLPAETVIKIYAERHITNPSDAKRKIKEVSLASDLQRGKKMMWMAKHGDVLSDTLEDVSRYAELGYHIFAKDGKLVFDIIQGKNKSRNNSENPIVFSLNAKTASENTYGVSDGDFKNIAYVEGKALESGLSSMLAVFDGDIPSGIERREMLVNASEGAYIENETTLSYSQIGIQHLSQHRSIETVNSTVVSVGDKEFLRDWDIGDIVTIESSRFGYSAKVRITGVKEIYSAGKITVSPIFGENPKVGKVLKNTIQQIRRTK